MLRRLDDLFEAFARTPRGKSAGRAALLIVVASIFLASAATAFANGAGLRGSAVTGLLLVGGPITGLWLALGARKPRG